MRYLIALGLLSIVLAAPANATRWDCHTQPFGFDGGTQQVCTSYPYGHSITTTCFPNGTCQTESD